jgi:predicted aconitase
MYLTKEEENVLRGECGWANQTCMRILVRLGDLFNADKLISIESAHVSGVSYKTLGDAPVEFLKALADADARVQVRTTLNPQSLDAEYLRKRIPSRLCEKQQEILQQFEKMGLTQSLTCTPYHLQRPQRGSHIAWAESSAVVYANSVLGAWTNREGGPSALAAAMIGKTPEYGIHKKEDREPNVLVSVRARLRNKTEYGALGICLGKVLEDKIPAVSGLHEPSKERLKQFSAALATTGMTNMFHLKKPPTKSIEKINIDDEDVKQTTAELSTTATESPDLVFIGCPHCSESEVKQIAHLIGGRKVKPGKEFWVCTSGYVKEKCGNSVKRIEHSGGHVLAGVCTVVSWTEMLGIETIMTNSAKTAHYVPNLSKAETILAPLKECLKTAFKG